VRLLLDECVPRPLKRELTGHDVSTVVERGWSSKRNTELLRLMLAEALRGSSPSTRTFRSSRTSRRRALPLLWSSRAPIGSRSSVPWFPESWTPWGARSRGRSFVSAPNKRLKLTGAGRFQGIGVLCPDGARTFVNALRRRVSRPQLKRDPLAAPRRISVPTLHQV